jgi:putative transposase
MDAVFLKRPFFGSRRLMDEMNAQGFLVGRDHVRTLMRLMGLAAVYPRPRLSAGNKAHKRFPYLLRNLVICRSDQVWCCDITYIRLKSGFAYLMAVMDWYSRYVLSWELSMSMESGFCLSALRSALSTGRPEIFNSDQGSQFTSEGFTQLLQDGGIQISRDGRGRAFDNIMIERLWRTVKYEEVFLKDYAHFFAAQESLGEYLEFYNEERRHSSFDGMTPGQVYRAGLAKAKEAV